MSKLPTIGEVVNELIDDGVTPNELASSLGVSTAMISTWKNEVNDFTPKFIVAQKLYQSYEIQIWPYDLDALKGL